MKENELLYLKKEVQCLRDELQMMQKVSPGLLRWGARGVGRGPTVGEWVTVPARRSLQL